MQHFFCAYKGTTNKKLDHKLVIHYRKKHVIRLFEYLSYTAILNHVLYSVMLTHSPELGSPLALL